MVSVSLVSSNQSFGEELTLAMPMGDADSAIVATGLDGFDCGFGRIDESQDVRMRGTLSNWVVVSRQDGEREQRCWGEDEVAVWNRRKLPLLQMLASQERIQPLRLPDWSLD